MFFLCITYLQAPNGPSEPRVTICNKKYKYEKGLIKKNKKTKPDFFSQTKIKKKGKNVRGD